MLLLVAFFLPDVAFAQLFHLGFILLTTFLVVDPLQEIFDDMRQKNVATLLARLKRLPRTSTSVFIDAFSQWPEVERAHFFNEGELQKNGYDQVCDTLSQHPNTLTRDSLWLDVNWPMRVKKKKTCPYTAPCSVIVKT